MSAPAQPARWKLWYARISFRSPFWLRSRWHRFFAALFRLGYLYVGVLIVLLLLENWFLFHPTTAAEEFLPPPQGLHVEDVTLHGKDGLELHAWWARPSTWLPRDGAVLYFHGNAGNLSQRGELVARWSRTLRLAVLIADYPGFGRSQGSPTEAGCYATGEAAYEWVTETALVPADRVVLLGTSLGGAIATDLATHHSCRVLVLMCSFTSFPDMAQHTFPWLPARWLVKNKLDNLAKIRTVKCPTFIAHGTADSMIPYSMGESLFKAATGPKRFFSIPGGQHDEATSAAFFAALSDFLDENETAYARAN